MPSDYISREITVRFAARSHAGRVRGGNEDNLFCNGAIIPWEARDMPFSFGGETPVPCIFAVCDGMGGESDGEMASFIAVTTLKEHAEKISRAASIGTSDAAVREFVSSANGILCGRMREYGKGFRMGTTLALAVVADGVVRAYNLGDSRVYVSRSGKLSRVTEDHTLAAQKVRMGLLTEEQAERDRDRHKLTQHLGIFEDEMLIEAYASAPLPFDGCRILICSDGLTDMVREKRIEEILNGARYPDEAVNSLVNEALENGGRDNVTCVVLGCGRNSAGGER